MKKIIIAIDGHSSCGKSTLAKALAKELGYTYVDSGAMYRAVTLFFIRHQVDLEDPDAVLKALDQIQIRFKSSGQGNRTMLNGEDVEAEIRQMPVSDLVSQVSAIPAVRRAMVKQQQAMGKDKGIVMDGRDIGTVVFPEAELKIFLTADMDERVHRRFLELQQKDLSIPMETVKRNLLHRDHIDSTREDSPLKRADDAEIIDNTHLTPSQQLELALQLVQDKRQLVP